MPIDNSAALITNARRRAHDAEQRATRTLAELEKNSLPVSVTEFANQAQVSRSWVYSHPDIKRRLNELRSTHPTVRPADQSVSSPASDQSLLTRLELAHQRVQALKAENAELRTQLARALGELRAARVSP